MPRRRPSALRAASRIPNAKSAATRSTLIDVGLARGSDADSAARENAAFVWSYYARFAALAFGHPRRRQIARIEVRGAEHLEAAAAQGRGVILLSAHLGDFDLGGAMLVDSFGVTPVVVSAQLPERLREWWFTTTRARCGVINRDLASTTRADLAGELRAGRAVLVMLDRRPSGGAVPSRLLGRASLAPLGIARLAAATGAPMLPAAMWRHEDGRPVGEFGAPATHSSEREAVVAVAVAGDWLSARIVAHPEQWHVPAHVHQLAWGSAVSAHAIGEVAISDRAAPSQPTPT